MPTIFTGDASPLQVAKSTDMADGLELELCTQIDQACKGMEPAERMAAFSQVSKPPGRPRSWFNSSILQLCSHRDARASLRILGQPETFLAPVRPAALQCTRGRDLPHGAAHRRGQLRADPRGHLGCRAAAAAAGAPDPVGLHRTGCDPPPARPLAVPTPRTVPGAPEINIHYSCIEIPYGKYFLSPSDTPGGWNRACR
jgi:hypothetical protein